jgi:hypothetical protein
MNESAFPWQIDNGETMRGHKGMTLRDYFAAKAMQGYCSDSEYKKECGQEDTAIAAYKMADAMMKAREL